MKFVHAIAVSLLLVSVNVVRGDFDEHTFIDEKTGHTLSINQGTEEEFEWAKSFCIQFFSPTYKTISLDSDQQAHGSYEAFIDAKFAGHHSKIFDEKKYTFFIVRDCVENKAIGYTIFDVVEGIVYSIETQAAITTYSIQSLMTGLAYFIKNQVAPDAEYFISAVRRAMPQFVEVLKSCDFVEGADQSLHPTLSCQYYQALIRTL